MYFVVSETLYQPPIIFHLNIFFIIFDYFFFLKKLTKLDIDLHSFIQTTLLSRLERIFEVCFPSMPVLEIEEEISSLNHLLEAGEKQKTAETTLADSR